MAFATGIAKVMFGVVVVDVLISVKKWARAFRTALRVQCALQFTVWLFGSEVFLCSLAK